MPQVNYFQPFFQPILHNVVNSLSEPQLFYAMFEKQPLSDFFSLQIMVFFFFLTVFTWLFKVELLTYFSTSLAISLLLLDLVNSWVSLKILEGTSFTWGNFL